MKSSFRSERAHTTLAIAMLVVVGLVAQLTPCIASLAPKSRCARLGDRQPDCVTTNCVPNSHRELNQTPPPPPRKRKKSILNYPFYKLILNHPFYKIILNHPFYKIILNHPFFFFRGLGYSLDFFDPQLL